MIERQNIAKNSQSFNMNLKKNMIKKCSIKRNRTTLHAS